MNANWCHVWVSLIEHSNPPQTKHIYIQVHQEYMFQFRVNKTDNNAFTCPVPACGRKYSRMSDLKSHFSLKHYEKFPEYPNMRTVGRYSCVGCCHTFTRKKNLIAHSRVCVHLQLQSYQVNTIQHPTQPKSCSSAAGNDSELKLKFSLHFILCDRWNLD